MASRFVVLTASILLAVFTISACAQGDYRDRYRDREVDSRSDSHDRYQENVDYLVEFFEHSDYRGDSRVYQIEREQRHVLIDFVGWDLNDRISSIRIGRNAGVVLFRDRDFKGPVAIYEYDVPLLDRDINDWASSAIVFDRELGGPLGVWIGEHGDPRDLFKTSFSGNVRFYPMSEEIDEMETRYYRIDEFNDNVEWVVIGPATGSMFRTREREGYRSRYGDRGGRGSQIEVSIYEHGDMRGRSILLPTRYSSGQTFVMKELDFYRIASSMVIREIRSRW
jgi:hypothetical protein